MPYVIFTYSANGFNCRERVLLLLLFLLLCGGAPDRIQSLSYSRQDSTNQLHLQRALPREALQPLYFITGDFMITCD